MSVPLVMELHEAKSLGLLRVVVLGHVHILDRPVLLETLSHVLGRGAQGKVPAEQGASTVSTTRRHVARFAGPVLCVDTCLLYTSDAADEEDSGDLGGRRMIKKKRK
eukprot:TRINITY_DN443_c0_g1_i20.p4 TRINITY_DN443_c0_g1~~TRINITY_DN443_c0_g1_i20.p4  ORF type:complete len:107 (+),score=15.92 TRINITY_DN443_c0_g1_i20:933-1253(+)